MQHDESLSLLGGFCEAQWESIDSIATIHALRGWGESNAG